MKIFLILFLIIIIIIIILYFINRYLLIEKFDGIDVHSTESSSQQCTPGATCTTDGGIFGNYNDSCVCISSAVGASAVGASAVGAPAVIATPSCTTIGNSCMTSDNFAGKYDANCICIKKSPEEVCIPNTTNFDKYCKDKNPLFGIKKIIPCDINNSFIDCGLNYINGKYYGDNVTITPCLNKSDDFDSWCRYYTNTNNIPQGYNVNSIGAKDTLVGSDGDCYLSNGLPDTNSARSVCDYSHENIIPKLEPENNKIDYNDFTECSPLKDDTYVTQCKTLLGSNAIAAQIMGYDCNPGFGRAKCVKNRTDMTTFNTNFYNESYTTEHQDLNIQCSTNC